MIRQYISTPVHNSLLIQGEVDPMFASVLEKFKDNFKLQMEIGSSLTVLHKSKPVVRLTGGLSDKKAGKIWDFSTLPNCYSITKSVTNFCVLLLIQRKLLQFDTTVASIWPEFASSGKEHVTIEQLLSHQAGLCCLDFDISVDSLSTIQKDPQLSSNFISDLARQSPQWDLNQSQSGYHALTVGWYLAEIIRRVDPLHRLITTFVDEELVQPLKLDFYFGIPSNLETSIPRVYSLQRPQNENSNSLPSLLTFKTFNAIENFHPWRARHLLIPSAIGFTTSDSLARLFDILRTGKDYVTSIEFFSSNLLSIAHQMAIESFDCVLSQNLAFSRLGLRIPHSKDSQWNNSSVFWHGGFGGSLAFCDRKNEFVVVYLTNGLDSDSDNDPRRQAILSSIYSSLFPHKL